MDTDELKYPVGMQTFSEIREEGFVYVDKTQYIPMLMRRGKYFFLGRPRRFGKSLFLSTLRAFFEGRRDLFEGLAVSRINYDWQPIPVFHIDFTGQDYTKENSLDGVINEMLDNWESKYEILEKSVTLELRFQNIIKAAVAKTGKKVVILIDEYDKPLLDTIEYPALQEKFRNQLRGIYGNLKKMDSYIKFAFLTGITRFGRLNIFSDLNNLKDISLLEDFSGISGITSEELRQYFAPGVEAFARRRGHTVEEMYDILRAHYDGYHFSVEGSPDIYNPYSLLNALQDKKIGEYWFATGTPSFLVKRIKEQGMELDSLNDIEVMERQIENIPFDMKGDPIPILYQSGYLTIKDYDPHTAIVTLGFPNREVEHGFMEQLLTVYAPASVNSAAFGIVKFMTDVRLGKVGEFMKRLQSLFASMNYDGFTFIGVEQHYQDVMYLLFKLLGYYCHTEYRTATGRIDMVVETERYVYVFEFKLNGTALAALEQIETKEYLLPFRMDGRRLFKIGANFSTEKKNLDGWEIRGEL